MGGGLGAFCLGAEAVVPHLYNQIVQGLKRCGLGEMELEYFNIHINCDDDHSLTMRKILERETRNSPDRRRRAKEAGYSLIKARVGFLIGITTFRSSTRKKIPA